MREHEFDYETLTSTQFQALVSALVVREHPRAQCMPLSGRDGGRDAVVQAVVKDGRVIDKIVYQAKMRQRSVTGIPTVDDLFRWVATNLQRERRRILRLIERGTTEYVLVMNIPGSGDLDKGLRDRVQAEMSDKISIAARAWWREDLDTRLRINPDIAASYGLLVGDNALWGLLGNSRSRVKHSARDLSTMQGEDLDVRVKAIKAFCADQYKEDQVLRFSQVDLDPIQLLDLFVDVPLRPMNKELSQNDETMEYMPEWQEMLSRLADLHLEHEATPNVEDRRYFGLARSIGTADLILLSESENLERVLIEGAPGQGKSTVSQYICQVHRARLLGKTDDLNRVTALHRHSKVRIPFRIELRRYASWLLESRKQSENGILRYMTEKVAQVSELRFETNDLVGLLCRAASLIVLDGLDEVADIETRNIVVEKIRTLSENLKAWDADTRIVLTTRPSTIFLGKDLSENEFSHFTLANLSVSLIHKYAAGWMSLKKLPQERRDELRAVLNLSLNKAHIADLARNPMQLAILLYLVNTRGRSLPEKRTALYHAYIETFQTRESDKSLPVSKYGDLLLDLHGYIAWLLHSRAELGRAGSAQGDIATDELIHILADYLDFEGYDRSLASQIFDGVQRFFVLVERVEGRFEFEVQPLREFFAARHLYTTSPQEPTVEEPAGTRPERLEALLRNPYWLNVLRFFAGNYQKGELADLARRLIDLAIQSEWSGTSKSYEPIYSILRDYSMYQSRRDTADVARVLASGLGLRLISHNLDEPYSRSKNAAVFTEDTGQKDIVRAVHETFSDGYADEVTRELAAILRANDPQVLEWWNGEWKRASGDNEKRRSLARLATLRACLIWFW